MWTLNVLTDRKRTIVATKFAASLKNVDIALIMPLSKSNIGAIIHRSKKNGACFRRRRIMKNLEDLLKNTDFSQDSMNKEAIKTMLLNTFKCGEPKKYARDWLSIRKNRFKPYAATTDVALAVGILVAACGEYS